MKFVLASASLRRISLLGQVGLPPDVTVPAHVDQNAAERRVAAELVHELSLSDKDKQRFGIENEWCPPEESAELRARLGLDKPEESVAAGTAAR